jgi:hypothetical protein
MGERLALGAIALLAAATVVKGRGSANWMSAGSVVKGDTIKFTEAVWGGSRHRPRHLGERINTARVLKESYGEKTGQHTFSLEIIESEGEQPLSPGAKTRRKGRNIYGISVQRLKWTPTAQDPERTEAAREAIAQEKHGRGDAVRTRRERQRRGSRGELVDLGAQRSRREAEEEAEREARTAQIVQGVTARQQVINRFLAGAKTNGLLQPVQVMVGWDPTAVYLILDTHDNTVVSPMGRSGLEVVESLMLKGVDPARDLWENVRRMNDREADKTRFRVLQIPQRPSERPGRP